MEVVSDSLMREEEESTTPARKLEVSISFGRFENDLLSWEKWSSFSQNKYLEEVEKCATPGSVAAKKAYFEARNKLIAVRKAEVLNKQMEACQETNEENDFQSTHAGEVDQYDEVIEENVFGSEISSPGMNEHPEVETNYFVPQEPNIKEVIKATSTNQLTSGESKLRSEMSSLGMNEQPDVKTNLFLSQEPDEKDVIGAVSTNELPSGEIILGSETRTPLGLVANFTKKNFTLFMLESDKLKNDNTYETIEGSNSEFDVFNGRISTGRVQGEQISELEHELSGCETDQPFSMLSFVSGCAQTDGEEQVGQPFEIGSKFDGYNDAPGDIKVESKVKIVLSPRKMRVDGTIDEYKARLVVKCYKQKEGLDYFDTNSPVTRITFIRMIIAIAALRNLEIHQMDVKTAFCNGELEEEIYIEQSEGCVVSGQEQKVCKLIKSLYGLKQAPKACHEKFDNVMMSIVIGAISSEKKLKILFSEVPMCNLLLFPPLKIQSKMRKRCLMMLYLLRAAEACEIGLFCKCSPTERHKDNFGSS